MGFVWPWKRHKKVNEVPDEMAAAEHAASLADGTDADGPKRRICLRYGGKVQAVGFRFQAQLLAQSVGVTGWVKNLDDGDVLLEVEGTEAQLSAYKKGIEDLSQSRNTWIEARLVSERDVPCVQERDFRVQY
ncbi:MAG: acylphosphatase [Atopobiaceae bacterium]